MLINNSKISEPFLWQRLLNFGNECYKKNDWLQAEYYYKEAESHLDYLWSSDTTNSQLLMAWITSLHNLAALFETKGDNHLGLQYLLIPHNRMLSITKSENASEDIKLIAINALKLTFTPILSFTKRNPICTSCVKAVNELKESIESYQRVEH
jgi:hypothetical protein